ncbi:hypothetical protein ACFODZ_03835 [Marinicella sediminis]|uniref:Cyclophilin-like domain-containing protein n=1 Tax=Marinicella sediminis TaxID=1792834 RepID=A0ABV7J5E3_9GAMM|nr:hypothetical protein [Marinicella sediminis]
MTTITITVDDNVSASGEHAIVVSDLKQAKFWDTNTNNKGKVEGLDPGPGKIMYRIEGPIGDTYLIHLEGAITASGKKNFIFGKIPKSTQVSPGRAVDINARNLIILN